MKTCEWPPCSKEFQSHKLWAKCCSESCRRKSWRKKQREAARALLNRCANETCENPISRKGAEFCSTRCRRMVYNRKRRAEIREEEGYKPKTPRERRGLLCKWCRGGHRTDQCPNRDGATVKQYGTQGPNGEYVPPKGVKVRVLEVPWAMCGDQLAEMLKKRENRRLKRRAAPRIATVEAARAT